ncbi:hypothetical protein SE91_26230 [Bradyrhizobium sp. DOA1]|nr:hypothetical protein SE91_26230 [Bradyrhizobium sp. DOA1]
MQLKVAQKCAERSALRCSFLVRMDPSIFQDIRFQPAPDQTDQVWITDAMRSKSETPIMIETPDVALRIRLQLPTYLAAGDSLIAGRQGMMRAELWPAAE